ncbi:8534_t:CDS:2 [Entrophospora sp. SA101]|nr:8534_t:CDS:2 [Entrophospora sp. SA101]
MVVLCGYLSGFYTGGNSLFANDNARKKVIEAKNTIRKGMVSILLVIPCEINIILAKRDKSEMKKKITIDEIENAVRTCGLNKIINFIGETDAPHDTSHMIMYTCKDESVAGGIHGN